MAVTGGAGFVGSHLCERLVEEGVHVVCVDNWITGSVRNIAHLAGNPGFTVIEADVSAGLPEVGPVDAVIHLASPASPRDYLRYPIETLRAGSLGTLHGLELARHRGARFLLASSSEVYGDPTVHPQTEDYRGNVNPVGPRAVYDESKRFAEAAAAAYARAGNADVRIARIFNTVGPRMRPDDGRMVPTFAAQALRGEPMTVHGDGSQTRTLCDVSDLVEGLWRLLRSDVREPVNLGGSEERSVLDIARLVAEACGVDPRVRFIEPMEDDPRMRRPDTSRARALLGWEARVPLREAVARAVASLRDRALAREPA